MCLDREPFCIWHWPSGSYRSEVDSGQVLLSRKGKTLVVLNVFDNRRCPSVSFFSGDDSLIADSFDSVDPLDYVSDLAVSVEFFGYKKSQDAVCRLGDLASALP